MKCVLTNGFMQSASPNPVHHQVELRGTTRFVLSVDSPLIPLLLQTFHDTPSGGHAGIKRTLVRLTANFFCSGLRQSITSYIAQCPIFQQIKTSTEVPTGLLQHLPIPKVVWEDVTMDFVTALPVSRGMSTILVVVDRLSKYAHFEALPPSFTVVKVAELFVDIVVQHQGFPKSIVSNCDTVFVSSFWRRLFELSGTKLSMISSYQPQTDGQTEVFNRGLVTFQKNNLLVLLFYLIVLYAIINFYFIYLLFYRF